MWICEPLSYLLEGLRFRRITDDSAVGLKNIVPITDVIHSRFFDAEVIAPPIGESLKPRTFGGCKSAYCIGSFDYTVMMSGTSTVYKGIPAIFKEILSKVTRC